MARKIRIAICIGAIILLSFIQVFGLTNITERKSSDFKYKPFFEEDKDFDILFMGTSHVINAVFPMELWQDYGITSYNFGGHGNEIATTYWVLENALDYTTPRVVVIDCLKLGSDLKVCENIEYAHYSFDAFPLTQNKIKAIDDLFDEKNKQEMLWDFTVYHSRWNELNYNDIDPAYTKEKGAESRIKVAVPKKPIWLKDKEKTPDHTVGADYLRKMIETCNKRGIKVLLTYLPFPPDIYHQKDANLADDIAKEYGVDYINFLNMKDIINFDTDCYDPNSHLNCSGARKVTDYLGSYIKTHYGLQDHRQEGNYANWDADYARYSEFKFNHLKQQDSLDNGLMLLADKNMSSCIYVQGTSGLLQDARMVELIKNLVPKSKLSKLEEAIKQKSDYLLVIDRNTGELIESTDKNKPIDEDVSFGKILFSDQASKIILNDKKEIVLGQDLNGNSAHVSIFATSKENNEVNCESYFNVTGVDENNNMSGIKVK